jgi:mannose-6-phosphate isomerase
VSIGQFSKSIEKIVEKVWGLEYWLLNTPNYCLKILEIAPNHRCSLHYHPRKDETFLVMEGTVLLETGTLGSKQILTQGEKAHIPPSKPHRFGSLAGAVILEISTTHSDEDVVRMEDSGLIPDYERNSHG